MCAVTSLEASTVQNWVKRGFVARPVNKKYRERQLARILLISSLRDCIKLESIGELMHYINGSADDESDDIIPEEELYDLFCNILFAIDNNSANTLQVEKTVSASVGKINIKDKKSVKRLENALTVMILAYIASGYKREAEKRLAKITEG